MIWKFIYYIRNVIWEIRRAWKGDPWEVEASNWDYCFTSNFSIDEIKRKLEESNWEFVDIPQYEYVGQIAGYHKYFENGNKQHHCRVMEGNEINCHTEWSWKHFYKHLKGIDCIKNCEAVNFLRGD